MKSRNLIELFGACALALAGVACGGSETNDEFIQAIPTSQMLGLNLEESEASALTLEQGLEGDPNTFRQRAQEIADKINATIEATHARLRALTEDVEPEERTIGARTCKQWLTTRDELDLRLRSCRMEQGIKRYSFVLHARPAASDDDADYKVIVGGRGEILPQFEGQRRGAGQIGYHFDNLVELTGQGPEGRVQIGYRAAGRARQLHLGLREFKPDAAELPINSIFNFVHVLGRGGVLHHVRFADLVTRDENDAIVGGTDGVAELGRISVAWRRDRAARIAAAVCGGTVGEGQCVRVVQCYTAAGEVSYENVDEPSTQPVVWEAVACPDVPMPIDGPPPPEGMEPPMEGPGGPGADGEMPGPSMDQPPPMPDFE